MRDNFSALLVVIGRIGVASLFLLGGVTKLLNFGDVQQGMHEVGLEPTILLLPMVIMLELGGGFLVAIGRRYTSIAALALAIFTIATNIFFHNFWSMEGERAALELSLFFKNISIAGALILVAGLSMKRQVV